MKKKKHSEYKYNYGIYCLIDDYKFPDNKDEWLNCPYCELKPKIWVYDNGLTTGCGCGDNMYDHWYIGCESIMSVHKRTNKTKEYGGREELKENWNHWCKTGVDLWENDFEETGLW